MAHTNYPLFLVSAQEITIENWDMKLMDLTCQRTWNKALHFNKEAVRLGNIQILCNQDFDFLQPHPPSL